MYYGLGFAYPFLLVEGDADNIVVEEGRLDPFLPGLVLEQDEVPIQVTSWHCKQSRKQI